MGLIAMLSDTLLHEASFEQVSSAFALPKTTPREKALQWRDQIQPTVRLKKWAQGNIMGTQTTILKIAPNQRLEFQMILGFVKYEHSSSWISHPSFTV